MKKAVIYTRVSGEPGLDRDGQREKLLAKFGKEYKIVGEGHDVGERQAWSGSHWPQDAA